MQKFDPYINIDPGTMNPVQHGEVFVTDDGAETDWIWDIMKDLSTKVSAKILMSPQERFTGLFYRRSAGEILAEEPFR